MHPPESNATKTGGGWVAGGPTHRQNEDVLPPLFAQVALKGVLYGGKQRIDVARLQRLAAGFTRFTVDGLTTEPAFPAVDVRSACVRILTDSSIVKLLNIQSLMLPLIVPTIPADSSWRGAFGPSYLAHHSILTSGTMSTLSIEHWVSDCDAQSHNVVTSR